MTLRNKLPNFPPTSSAEEFNSPSLLAFASMITRVVSRAFLAVVVAAFVTALMLRAAAVIVAGKFQKGH